MSDDRFTEMSLADRRAPSQSRRILGMIASVLLFAGLALGLTACGGDDGGEPAQPDGGNLTVASIQEGFEAETGRALVRKESDFGLPPTLVFDDDGDIMEVTDAEIDVIREFGSFTIYVGEEGNPQTDFDLLIGKSERSTAPSGESQVTLTNTVARQPDENGVVWKKSCVDYQEDPSLNVCSWTAFKQYGDNVLVTWTANSGEIDEKGTALLEAMDAATGS
jgi:hypothetical protein